MDYCKLIAHMRQEAQDYRSGRTLGRAFADAEDVLDDAAAAIETLRDKLAARDALVDRLETENYRLRGMARECINCLSWTRDTDPETGEEIHRCGNPRSPRLDDITRGGESCGNWTADFT